MHIIFSDHPSPFNGWEILKCVLNINEYREQNYSRTAVRKQVFSQYPHALKKTNRHAHLLLIHFPPIGRNRIIYLPFVNYIVQFYGILQAGIVSSKAIMQSLHMISYYGD